MIQDDFISGSLIISARFFVVSQAPFTDSGSSDMDTFLEGAITTVLIAILS